MAVILVVDDSVASVELMVTIFTGESHEVLKAHNGQAGLDVIRDRAGQIDILLTDNSMPLMGGVELIQTVKREFPHIKTILMSVDPTVAGPAKEAGADRYFRKGGYGSDIRALVGELLAEIRKSGNGGG